MLIQGDVLATLAIIIGSCVSAWALTIAYGLLFTERAEISRQIAASSPGRCVARGALIVATLGVLGIGLLSNANPVGKLLGWILLLVILSVAALGLSGFALNAGERIRRMDPAMNPYAAFSRGTAFLIVGCILPIVGWFAFGPLLFLASVGVGSKAAFQKGEVLVPLETA